MLLSSTVNSYQAKVEICTSVLNLGHCSWHAENCNGGLSLRDLQRVATAHDFMWTDKELADMIRCFDSDGDGKVSSCCSECLSNCFVSL